MGGFIVATGVGGNRGLQGGDMACVALSGREFVSGLAVQSSLLRSSFLRGSRVVLSGRSVRNTRGGCRRLCTPSAGLQDGILDRMKKLIGGGSVQGEGRKLKPLFFNEDAPSWGELEALLEEKKSALGVEKPDLETGPPNPMALKRTFGSNEPVRVKLYRDHAAWCPYCQKVQI